ncbi:MAG: hypothetical protein C4617_04410 [Candidatus Liberibacter europaeus]|uniref:Uncharacterized protein n=1 Tax=Candidatus Liberibacter europaeus TaxID=744859 RepID=A0A2T4VWM1_9HYPH|nr:hypothetical protein [Candidatus Liberibacter europaeus]MBY7649767.1 hypothetical protein [Candidatus Liberibacter europaeus]PTL86173.1 MAG: hypothetical protein C4617_04690 [Candidatus Liberibacter europaeus]PTL86254.1 MAG: hypothetical protein C4617_04410 [Candidatus Liberibacter europaeus]
MAKKQDQYITREEFVEFCTKSNAKQDCLISHCKVFEKHYREQQKGVNEILDTLKSIKWLFSTLKNVAIIVTSITAIIYGILNVKGWFKH